MDMIKGERINLKPISERDIEMLRLWRNRYADSFFSGETITKEMQRQWYTQYQESNHTDLMWILVNRDNEPCGTIALYDISIPNRTAKLGRVLLLEEYRQLGYMEEAVKLVCKLAFETMRLYQLRVETFFDNAEALSLYLKCGFTSTKRPIVLLERKNIIPYEDLNKQPMRVEI